MCVREIEEKIDRQNVLAELRKAEFHKYIVVISGKKMVSKFLVNNLIEKSCIPD